MNLLDVLQNKVLIAVLVAWLLAQIQRSPRNTCARGDG